MKRYFAIGFVIGLLATLTACQPAKGNSCNTPGKTWAHNGTVLHCQPNHKLGGNTWQ